MGVCINPLHYTSLRPDVLLTVLLQVLESFQLPASCPDIARIMQARLVADDDELVFACLCALIRGALVVEDSSLPYAIPGDATPYDRVNSDTVCAKPVSLATSESRPPGQACMDP